MNRLLVTLAFMLTMIVNLQAMSYKEARKRAWFLTDKMAYELDLTPEQYDMAYEINLDYFLSIRNSNDCRSHYWHYRNSDLRYVLFDWQYALYRTIDYFYRPIRWVRSSWYFPVCNHYRYGYYYFHRPTIYVSYQGRSWRRRSHNDVSPYSGMRLQNERGMRNRLELHSEYRKGNRSEISERNHYDSRRNSPTNRQNSDRRSETFYPNRLDRNPQGTVNRPSREVPSRRNNRSENSNRHNSRRASSTRISDSRQESRFDSHSTRISDRSRTTRRSSSDHKGSSRKSRNFQNR